MLDHVVQLHTIYIYMYKITSRQNNIELGTRRNEVSLIILITDKREKPIPCQSSRHTSAVWENLFRECRTQMCHASCLATLPLDLYVAAAYKNQQSMSIKKKRVVHMGSTFQEQKWQNFQNNCWTRVDVQEIHHKWFQASFCKNMQLLCGWWYIMNAKCGLWCIHTQ